ncbi:hypothetical protein AB0O31_33040 [Kitasatospora cineracea]|uniref:hypothetical protein n=1 Tax=Kitasatospora cineracea TaxID=88074 RepID=UPI0034188BBE
MRHVNKAATNWVQTHRQALTKGQHDHNPGQSSAAGRAACAAHVVTYTATQAAVLLVGARVLGIHLRPGRVAAALALSAATHYIADRREPLRHAAEAIGKGEYYALADFGMNGAYALDQATHHALETVAAVLASR